MLRVHHVELLIFDLIALVAGSKRASSFGLILLLIADHGEVLHLLERDQMLPAPPPRLIFFCSLFVFFCKVFHLLDCGQMIFAPRLTQVHQIAPCVNKCVVGAHLLTHHAFVIIITLSEHQVVELARLRRFEILLVF